MTAVLGRFILGPKKSLHRITSETIMSKSCIHCILKKNQWHPYKMQTLQALSEDDPGFKTSVLFTDEATYHPSARHGMNKHRYDLNC
jgi:hypothetical protein